MTEHRLPPAGPVFVLTHLALCSLAWGSSFYFIKLMGGALPPVYVAAFRGLTAMLALAALMLARGFSPLPARDEILPWAIIGLLNGALPNTLVAFAMERMDSGPAVLIQSFSPLVTALAAHLLFAEERLSVRALVGVLTGLAGVGLLIGPGALSGQMSLAGSIAMLSVALCYAAGNIYTRLVRHHDAMRLALGQQIFSALFAGSAALALVTPPAMATLTANLWPILLLGIVTTAIPITLFMRLIVRAGPTRAALTGYSVPAVAVLIGALALGERLTMWQVAGGLTVFFGVFIVATSRRVS